MSVRVKFTEDQARTLLQLAEYALMEESVVHPFPSWVKRDVAERAVGRLKAAIVEGPKIARMMREDT